MDIVIALFVSICILYYLYGNPTKRKFERGVDALTKNQFDLAEKYFFEISNKHPLAKSKVDEIAFKRGEICEKEGLIDKAYNYFLQIKHNTLLTTVADEKLTAIDFRRGSLALSDGDLDSAYNHFSKIANKNKVAFFESAKIDFKRGVTAELSQNLSLAKECYERSSLFKEDLKIYLGAICRKNICELKSDVYPSEEEISLLKNNSLDESLKTDFFFRYTSKLIRDGKYSKALETIQGPGISDTKLKEQFLHIIENRKKARVREIANAINSILLEKPTEIPTIESIYKEVLLNEHLISEFPSYTETLREAKDNLFNKLILLYLTEGHFEKCLNHILAYPNFISKVELLKNLGICCVRIALARGLNEANFKNLISIWLTSIYNDDIFMNSLETTTWDDQYTFSVKNSLGRYSRFLFDIEVENINRNEPSDENISIGQAQRELLSIFENSLNEVQPESLNSKVRSFYTSEKEAIDQLTKSLGFNITHSTPEFAKEFKIDKTILKYLNFAYEKHKKEELLELGSKYVTLVFNENGGVMLQTNLLFEKYASSLYYSRITLDYIKTKKANSISDTSKDVINRYPSIRVKFEAEALSILRGYANTMAGEEINLIQLMNKVFKVIPSENMGYFLSEYITSYCIDKINSKAITPTRGLELLVDAIVASPENHRTAKNLAVLISVNLMNDAFKRKVKESIPVLKQIESETLYESFLNELSPIKEELKVYFTKPNIDYAKIRSLIHGIDELMASVEPVNKLNGDADLEF